MPLFFVTSATKNSGAMASSSRSAGA